MRVPISLSKGVRRGVCVGILLAVIGCRTDTYVVPEEPVPPNTVLLSQMMRELSATPGFTDALLTQLDRGEKKGPALMTPALMKRLRELILGKDWQGLDRFPGWTMQEVNPAVGVISRVATKYGEAPAGTPSGASTEAAPSTSGRREISEYVDLGSYSVAKTETVSLDKPSTLPALSDAALASELGAGVVRGDLGNPRLAPMHPESQRLAGVLNRLGVNGLNGAAQVTAETDGRTATTPEELVQALIETGHSVVVADARYFANFGHFHYKGQDVMMPFFVNSQIAIPGAGRSLLVPVSHAEYEWQIRGPKVNADVSWYFGIDGKAEFRTMDTLDQAWVLGRHAHEYRGADAVQVTRLAGKMLVAYMHQHLRRPDLPFGGYYALGVCQDSVAAIERKMTGHDTLFPNTADGALFDDPRDAEVNAMILAIPKDRNGAPPSPERIFGSLPTTNFRTITIPGLAVDLEAVHAAWQDGSLERTRSWIEKMTLRFAFAGALIVVAGVLVWRRRRARK